MKSLTFSCLTYFFLVMNIYSANFYIDNIKFSYYEPIKHNENSKIILLFGGRNWDSEKSLKTYNFYDFADKHNAFLLSPTFVNKNYWEVENWSGTITLKAIDKIKEKYSLHDDKIYIYGYSAGAQCATSFLNWQPKLIETLAIHACGVYPQSINATNIPILITCGINDKERVQISKNFIYNYREKGGQLLWKIYPYGHNLNSESLEIAKAWFEAIMTNQNTNLFGEDDTFQINSNIDIEYRNPLFTPKIKDLWLK